MLGFHGCYWRYFREPLGSVYNYDSVVSIAFMRYPQTPDIIMDAHMSDNLLPRCVALHSH